MIWSPNRTHFGGSCAARTSTLTTLRGSIERIEAHGDAYTPGRVALGHADADATLQGGLAVGAVHEVFAEAGRQSAAATGFVAGLAGRAAARRPLVWVRQDFTEIETGALSMSGLAELGLDPRLLVTVHAADVDTALRTAADAFACDALGAVVLEVWGEARPLDLVASRKLTLAAQASGVTGLLLRLAAEPSPSTAETRWIVRAAHSPPAPLGPAASLMPAASLGPAAPWSAWGAPVFDAELVRNRHGPVGRWIMEWKCDECLFSKPAAYPQPVAAAPAHRPYQTSALAQQRHAS
ncbi:ImuA family protein [Bradyrhizobium sp. URHD0069]|uniref:ImuA family protein n=1 Tax=Bradyrhizobium sp. URHD0069 TaxID=1380355 RepID=UPI00068DAB6C|nr:DNA repair protein [Bradyrhizobium sp. URHD0069]